MKAVRRKTAAWALCVLLAVGLFLSAWFVVREVRHLCTGENCPVCAGMQAAAQRLKSGARPAAPATLNPAVRRPAVVAGGVVRLRPGTTPVDCKVRLDN